MPSYIFSLIFLRLHTNAIFDVYNESMIYFESLINIDGDEFEFSVGFTELHTKSYQHILAGDGFRISEAMNCIKIVHDIRNATPIGLVGDYHPLAKLPLAKHPFGWDDVHY